MVLLYMCSKVLLPFSCTAEEIIGLGIQRIFCALRENLRCTWKIALHAPTLPRHSNDHPSALLLVMPYHRHDSVDPTHCTIYRLTATREPCITPAES